MSLAGMEAEREMIREKEVCVWEREKEHLSENWEATQLHISLSGHELNNKCVEIKHWQALKSDVKVHWSWLASVIYVVTCEPAAKFVPYVITQ